METKTCMSKFLSIMCLALGLSCSVPANAADLSTRPAPSAPPVLSPSAWQFRATLYGWATGINGDIGVGRLPPANVDLPFNEIFDHLTGAFMGNFVASNGQFLLGADLVWSRLNQSVDFKIDN